MPLPDPSVLDGLMPGSSCGSSSFQLTLQEMTDAYSSANDTDKGAWINALSDDPFGSFLLGNIATNALNNNDQFAIQATVQMLESDHWFYSPDTPPPVPVLTLQNVITAFQNASSSDQHEFANLIAGQVTNSGSDGGLNAGYIAAVLNGAPNQNLNAILSDFGVTPIDDSQPPIVNIDNFLAQQNGTQDVVTTPLLPTVLADLCWEWGAQFVFGQGENSISVVYNPVSKCMEVVGTIYLGGNGGLDKDFSNEMTPSVVCLNGLPSTQNITVPVGNQSGFAYLTFSIIQQLFLKLDQLLRCCKPCDDTNWIDDGIKGGIYTFTVATDVFVSEVKVTEEPGHVSIDEFPNEPPWKRFGRIVWHSVIGVHDAEYIRYSGQVFYAPNQICTGFSVSFNEDVTMDVQHKELPAATTPGS